METTIDSDVLSRFEPLDQLDDEGLRELARKIHIEQLPKKRHLFVRGQHDRWAFFLINGKLILSQHGNIVDRVEGNSHAACRALDQNQPRQLTAISQTPVEFIRIDRDLLELLLSKDILPIYKVEELGEESEGIEERLLHNLVRDFLSDALIIPSLPELALRISRAVDDPNMDANHLARMIQYDAGIAARLIQVTNSPLYQIDPPVSTCRGAVEHLGFQLVKNLVLSYSLQQLFFAESPTLQRSMKGIWRKTSQVAAMSFLLARETRHLNPDRAFLAGVLHGIGRLAVISHAGRYPELANNAVQLELTMDKLGCHISAMILRKWGFGDEILTTALESDIWQRDPGRHADYCDVVLLARLHQAIGTPMQRELPRIDSVPAFNKIARGQLSPEGSIQILENARAELRDLESLLVMH